MAYQSFDLEWVRRNESIYKCRTNVLIAHDFSLHDSIFQTWEQSFAKLKTSYF